MMTPQQLKSSILQRAIEGKLVEQRPEEGTANELLKQIKAEKDRLVKEGKIKKTKPLPPITEDEIPFEIPESWKWIRLGDSCKKLTDGSHNPPPDSGSGYKVISAKNIKDGNIIFDNVARFVDEIGFAKENPRTQICYGDIIMGIIGGSIGNLAIYKHNEAVIAQRSIAIMASLIENNYVYYFLQAPYIQRLMKSSSGTAQGGMYLGAISSLLMPLPPLAEQLRIVGKIEELLPMVDEYDKAYSRLAALNEKFPQDMKKSILQYAIEGKLVEQRPEEGTAADLLKQIKAEKAKLVKEGKIKKEKPLPPITEDEIPFDIPEEWVWCRLGDIGDWGSGATPARVNSEYYDGDISWVKTGDLNDGYILETPEHISEIALKDTSVRLNPVGSVLMAMYGATIGKLGILSTEATTNQACCACIPFPQIYNRFLFYYLLSQRRNFTKLGAGGAQPNISRKKIVEYLFPLPPISEQKRIVSKLEEFVSLCDKLSL